jgi:hypothetical protein
MRNTSKNDPTRWMLGGDPPEPQTSEPAKPAVDDDGNPVDLRNGDTHTGTDPLGRAIGPRENHLAVKRVRDKDGKIVTPSAGKGRSVAQAEARARKVAEATGTKPEAADDPKPVTPAQVAKAHAAGVVVEVEDD